MPLLKLLLLLLYLEEEVIMISRWQKWKKEFAKMDKKLVFSLLVGGGGRAFEVSDENESKKGHDDHDQVFAAAASEDVRGRSVALVLLTEAHPATASALSHTNVVHHKVVDIEVVRATSANFGLGCKKAGRLSVKMCRVRGVASSHIGTDQILTKKLITNKITEVYLKGVPRIKFN